MTSLALAWLALIAVLIADGVWMQGPTEWPLCDRIVAWLFTLFADMSA